MMLVVFMMVVRLFMMVVMMRWSMRLRWKIVMPYLNSKRQYDTSLVMMTRVFINSHFPLPLRRCDI